MCGIAGFVNLDGAPADTRVLARMTDVQRYRGPDDQGLSVFSLRSGSFREIGGGRPAPDGVFEGALGFNRLKILDLSEHGHQPMANADGNVILAFNGEVYNAFDYTRELEASGFRFRSRTDTEVVLYLYEKFGLDGLLDRLNGMFAMAILDLRTRDLHLVRDQMGIKPLYWAQVGQIILFASEAKAFLAHPAFDAEIDAGHIDEYLAFRYVAGDASLMKGVRQLRPGHTAHISAAGVTVRRYWQIPDVPNHARLTDVEALDRLDALLHASVTSQLLSDVKVGCQLSGGIDSSLVSVFARSGYGADMDAFSVVFDDPTYSEEEWIDQAAAAANVASLRFRFTPELFFDTLDTASWHMDQPISHPNALGIWLIAREARDNVTVLLSGEGADEIFGGYTRFYYAGLRPKVEPWLPILKHLPTIGPRIERQFGSNPADAFIHASTFQQPSDVLAVRPQADLAAVTERRRVLFSEGTADHVSNCLKYEMQTYLVDLLVRQDKMTMAHSIENRVPFLDRNLIAFARTLPTHHLVGQSVFARQARMRGTKVLLKRLARRTFSERFVYRKKSGFSLPLDQYFRDARFVALMEERVLPGIGRRGLLSAQAVRANWSAIVRGMGGEVDGLWIAVAFELWAQAFLDRKFTGER